MIIETKIENLVPDDLNANKGTEYGQHLIENSLRKFGAGRSILIDRNNRIIAGNKTIENAANIGLDNVIVVETDGNQIVAVKRKDIDLDSEKGVKWHWQTTPHRTQTFNGMRTQSRISPQDGTTSSRKTGASTLRNRKKRKRRKT